MPTVSGYENLPADVHGWQYIDLASYADVYQRQYIDLSVDAGGHYPVDLGTTITGVTGRLAIINFFLDEGRYTAATGILSVDLVDYKRPINTSECYLTVDGVQVSGTLVPTVVPDLETYGEAYTLYYDPSDDFSSLKGSTTYTARVVNDLGQSLERSFYLTYGYLATFPNEENKYLHYGIGEEIIVKMSAENLDSCPKESNYAYLFETIDFKEKDLGASIVGTVQPSSNLSASINPQTGTNYFYGATYRLVINAKDFSGNKMKEFVLEFTIEDKPT